MSRQSLNLGKRALSGTYVGQAYDPGAVNVADAPQVVVFVGAGNHHITAENLEIVRGQVLAERLTFNQTAPHIAHLAHPSNGSQISQTASIRLYNDQDEEVPAKFWAFTQPTPGGAYDQVQIFGNAYSSSDVYYLDYLSTDITVLDQVPVEGLRGIVVAGDRVSEDRYKSGTDFKMNTTIEAPVAGTNTGTGTLTINNASNYQSWDKKYHFRVEAKDSVSMPTLGNPTKTGTGTAKMTLAPTCSYTGEAVTWTLTVASKNASQATIDWSNGTLSGSLAVTADGSYTIAQGLVVAIASFANLAVGDIFTIVAANSSVTRVQFSWYSEDRVSSSGLFYLYSHRAITGIPIESGLILDFSTLSGYSANDSWTVQCINNCKLDWSLTRDTVQSIASSEIYMDAMGYVTGTPGAYYITLGELPIGAVTLTKWSDGSAISGYSVVKDTPYVKLTNNPGCNIKAAYSFRNAPQLGQVYRVTAQYTRPRELYNVAQVFTSWPEYRKAMGYPSPSNHLGIMGDYAFNEVGNTIVAAVQIEDADCDGIYTNADFRNGLKAARLNLNLTDVCILGNSNLISDIIQDSQFCNDPLYGALRSYWVGYPIGSRAGTALDDEGSIAYSASVELQVNPGDFAMGSFNSVANPWVKRTITLEDGSSKQLQLDGTFFAAACACVQAAFSDPNTAMLKQAIPGFDDIATFNFTERNLLATAGNFVADKEGNVIRLIEAVTTCAANEDYREPNTVVVKRIMSKRVIKNCNTALIGYTPRNEDEGITFIRKQIMSTLTAGISEGLISDFVDSTGRVRSIQVEDVDVWRSEENKTRYNFNYWMVMRYVIKQLAGMYSVDRNLFRV